MKTNSFIWQNHISNMHINSHKLYQTRKQNQMRSTLARAVFAEPENNLILLLLLLTDFSTRADSKNFGKFRSFRIGIFGLPFPYFNGSDDRSHLYNQHSNDQNQHRTLLLIQKQKTKTKTYNRVRQMSPAARSLDRKNRLPERLVTIRSRWRWRRSSGGWWGLWRQSQRRSHDQDWEWPEQGKVADREEYSIYWASLVLRPHHCFLFGFSQFVRFASYL